jgi:hypothetical protein
MLQTPRIPQPSRSQFQTRSILFGRRAPWLGFQHQLHPLDAIRVCNILDADGAPGYED